MEIQIDTEAVFASPLDCLEEVGPANFGKEWLSRVDFDSPERKWNADPIETSSGNLSEIFFGDEGSIMVFYSAEITVSLLDESMEGPLVDGIGVKGLIEGRSNEWFDDKPATKINPAVNIINSS